MPLQLSSMSSSTKTQHYHRHYRHSSSSWSSNNNTTSITNIIIVKLQYVVCHRNMLLNVYISPQKCPSALLACAYWPTLSCPHVTVRPYTVGVQTACQPFVWTGNQYPTLRVTTVHQVWRPLHRNGP